MKAKNLIVGAGLTGAVIAERLAAKGKPSLVIDRRDHIGGNCYDYNDGGITIHKYGPHAFHTNNKIVWDYLSRFTEWRYFFLKTTAHIDNQLVPIPFNIDTIYALFPNNLAEKLIDKLIAKYEYGASVSISDLQKADDGDLKFLANFIYEKVFKNYTAKQWGIDPKNIDLAVLARVPVVISRDDGYFHDKYQGIPRFGYTNMIANILKSSPLIETRLNTDFKTANIEYENLYYTGAIDEFFDYKFGELPYRSLRFDVTRIEKEYVQPTAVVNYPNNHDFTRICEHKRFLDEQAPHTIVSVEYPELFERGKNERYYPIESPQNRALYEKYLAAAKKSPNAYFLGRLGEYRYYNMDDTVDRAMKTANFN
ncbi:MAG: UDP-galactopyranose mutase [Helicobacteraceae bacterium]|jgi:UDP-galactopyranose mutase|nr:UDP-galactopyranose mutase [Helicobacteraceae bacterium]